MGKKKPAKQSRKKKKMFFFCLCYCVLLNKHRNRSQGKHSSQLYDPVHIICVCVYVLFIQQHLVSFNLTNYKSVAFWELCMCANECFTFYRMHFCCCCCCYCFYNKFQWNIDSHIHTTTFCEHDASWRGEWLFIRFARLLSLTYRKADGGKQENYNTMRDIWLVLGRRISELLRRVCMCARLKWDCISNENSTVLKREIEYTSTTEKKQSHRLAHGFVANAVELRWVFFFFFSTPCTVLHFSRSCWLA